MTPSEQSYSPHRHDYTCEEMDRQAEQFTILLCVLALVVAYMAGRRS